MRSIKALVLSLLSSSLLAVAPAHAQTLVSFPTVALAQQDNGDTYSVNAAGRGIRAAHPASLDAARRSARAAAAGSLAAAQSNARTAVQAIGVDLQVLAQWTTAAPPHSVASYQDLLAHAHSYDDVINVTAQALADDVQVEARLHAVMPPKAIMVSIGEQVLRAYQDGRLVLFTYVTTGRPELPTVTGHFYIYEKVTPWQFTSPWPPGSPYYYPPTWIKYWMPFYSGYGLHDAWWRQHYGPGTNVYGDGPGSKEPTGTHGCVNIPFAQTQWLWNWAPVGTPVVVYGGPSVTPGTAGI
jgi:lipoprotein-anchoring transpeptidase ErfK/SrfK